MVTVDSNINVNSGGDYNVKVGGNFGRCPETK